MAVGADAIVIPEVEITMEEVIEATASGRAHGKDHSLIVLAEGVTSAAKFVKEYEALTDEEIRGVTLSHVQRGGSPTVRDRAFATMMGAKAVDLLVEGQSAVYVGMKQEHITVFDIVETLQQVRHEGRLDMYQVNKELKEAK